MIALLNAITDCLIIFTPIGYISDVNDSFLKHLGMSRESFNILINGDILGVNEIFFPKIDLKKIQKGRTRNYKGEFFWKSNDTSYLVEGKVLFIEIDRKGYFILNFIDKCIAPQKREKNLDDKKLKEILRGRISGVLFNDFRGIFGLVSGYAEMALESLRTGVTDVQSDLKEILIACGKGKELIDKATLLTKEGDIFPQLLDAEKFLNEVIKSVRTFAQKNLVIESKIERISEKLLVDPIKLEQLLIYIILEITQHETTLTHCFYLKISSCVESIVQKNGVKDKFLTIKLQYNPSEKRTNERLTDRFFVPGASKEYFDSDFFKKLAYNQGVNFLCESKESEIFWLLQIPISTSVEQEPPPLYPGRPKGNGETVLVVDDETAVADVTYRRLQKLGYNTIVRTNPVDVLTLLLEENRKIDLLITDQIMPEMSGLQLVQKIKSKLPNLKIVMMTGYASGITPELCLQYGVSRLAMKPLDEGELAVIVSEELKKDN